MAFRHTENNNIRLQSSCQALAVPSRRFPTRFIPDKHKRHLYGTTQGFNQKQLIPDRYEFLVYKLLRDGLEKGEIHCPDSLRFRSFEDDLIGDEQWKNKDSLIKEANLPILQNSIINHLRSLEELLENRLELVNKRILSGENRHFVTKRRGKKQRWTLEYPRNPVEINDSFFDSIPVTSINNVLRFVQRQTGFMEAFEHLLGKNVKTGPRKRGEGTPPPGISPIGWQHINFLGRYEFEQLGSPINVDEIVDSLTKSLANEGQVVPF